MKVENLKKIVETLSDEKDVDIDLILDDEGSYFSGYVNGIRVEDDRVVIFGKIYGTT